MRKFSNFGIETVSNRKCRPIENGNQSAKWWPFEISECFAFISHGRLARMAESNHRWPQIAWKWRSIKIDSGIGAVVRLSRNVMKSKVATVRWMSTQRNGWGMNICETKMREHKADWQQMNRSKRQRPQRQQQQQQRRRQCRASHASMLSLYRHAIALTGPPSYSADKMKGSLNYLHVNRNRINFLFRFWLCKGNALTVHENSLIWGDKISCMFCGGWMLNWQRFKIGVSVVRTKVWIRCAHCVCHAPSIQIRIGWRPQEFHTHTHNTQVDTIFGWQRALENAENICVSGVETKKMSKSNWMKTMSRNFPLHRGGVENRISAKLYSNSGASEAAPHIKEQATAHTHTNVDSQTTIKVMVNGIRCGFAKETGWMCVECCCSAVS